MLCTLVGERKPVETGELRTKSNRMGWLEKGSLGTHKDEGVNTMANTNHRNGCSIGSSYRLEIGSSWFKYNQTALAMVRRTNRASPM